MKRNSLIIVFSAAIILAGCHKNNPPVIEEVIASSDSIGTGENTTLFVDAYDEDGDELTFTWDCAFGTFSSDTGRSVVWTAPGIPDVYLITVTAEDTDGATDDAAILIKVGAVGGGPANVTVTAHSDGLQVVLMWEAPDADEPDEYIIYFQAVGTTYWVNVGTVNALTYIHDPGELTGDYIISAVYGNDEYNSNLVTTMPVHTAALSVSELNAGSNSGYGWALSDFFGCTYSMADASNAPFVDFYVTDFATGTATSDWYVASPNEGPNDPGGVVPDDGWKQRWFTDPLTNSQAALPAFGATTYFNWTPNIEVNPTYIGAYLEAEGYFALIKFSNINMSSGTIQAETWFQTVQGLRLIAH